jgi:hypothetical protein
VRLPARLVVFAFAVTFAFAGCGGTNDGGLSATTRAQLASLVEQVRSAAGSRDRQGAKAALAELQRAVASYKSQGDISSARAAEILTAAAQVQTNLALVPVPTTTTTTTTTAPPDHKKGGDGKGKGDKGDGKG